MSGKWRIPGNENNNSNVPNLPNFTYLHPENSFLWRRSSVMSVCSRQFKWKTMQKIQNFRVTSFSNAIVGTSFQKQPSLASHGNMTKTMVINIVSLFLFHGYALRGFQFFSHFFTDHTTCFYAYQFFFLYLGKTLTNISGFLKPGHTGGRWQIPSSTHFAILFFRLIQGLKIIESIIKISSYKNEPEFR